jgi:hypothetical protein
MLIMSTAAEQLTEKMWSIVTVMKTGQWRLRRAPPA